MKTIILCGGKGTRLREETEFRPKPMVPIGNMPILWHIMKLYAQYGHKDFVLCLGYKGEVIKEFFRNYLWNQSDITINTRSASKIIFHNVSIEEDWRVTLVDTGEESMTAYRVKAVQKFIPDGEPFMLTYGDGLADINLNNLLAHHLKAKKKWTLTAVQPPSRFGALHFDQSGTVYTFEEKRQKGDDYINGGFMVCEYDVFNYLSWDPNIMLERDPIFAAVKDKELSCYKHEGFWQCMDTYQECKYLNGKWSKGVAPWKVW